jgi:hypothetical protein
MRVWLDDVRPIPAQGFTVHVKTAAEAISLLASGQVEAISLDHDLGPPEAGTGYEVAKYIEEQAYHGKLPKLVWTIHSANTVGRKNMEAALGRAEQFWLQSGQ